MGFLFQPCFPKKEAPVLNFCFSISVTTCPVESDCSELAAEILALLKSFLEFMLISQRLVILCFFTF